jgi:hypothetical protein
MRRRSLKRRAAARTYVDTVDIRREPPAIARQVID